MRLSDLKFIQPAESDTHMREFRLTDCVKLAGTKAFKDKVFAALNIIEYFFKITKMPAVSFGGGKDGTAVLILAQMIDPNVLILTADPPNPLPDREKHILTCEKEFGSKIIHVPYTWDVDSVLNHKEKYPAGFKQKRLRDEQTFRGIDGIIWGCRNSESRARAINFHRNGYVYQCADGTWRCQPIATWTAEDAFALALATGYPINPVYEKMEGIFDLDNLHDGTWWPHGDDMKCSWIKRYYPDYFDSYMKAVMLGGKSSKYLETW